MVFMTVGDDYAPYFRFSFQQIRNIGDDDIGDILREIPEEFIKNSVKEGAGQIFKKSTEEYLQMVCQKLVERMQKKNMKLL